MRAREFRLWQSRIPNWVGPTRPYLPAPIYKKYFSAPENHIYINGQGTGTGY